MRFSILTPVLLAISASLVAGAPFNSFSGFDTTGDGKNADGGSIINAVNGKGSITNAPGSSAY